jgi:hypothetical protein
VAQAVADSISNKPAAFTQSRNRKQGPITIGLKHCGQAIQLNRNVGGASVRGGWLHYQS